MMTDVTVGRAVQVRLDGPFSVDESPFHTLYFDQGPGAQLAVRINEQALAQLRVMLALPAAAKHPETNQWEEFKQPYGPDPDVQATPAPADVQAAIEAERLPPDVQAALEAGVPIVDGLMDVVVNPRALARQVLARLFADATVSADAVVLRFFRILRGEADCSIQTWAPVRLAPRSGVCREPYRAIGRTRLR